MYVIIDLSQSLSPDKLMELMIGETSLLSQNMTIKTATPLIFFMKFQINDKARIYDSFYIILSKTTIFETK